MDALSLNVRRVVCEYKKPFASVLAGAKGFNLFR